MLALANNNLMADMTFCIFSSKHLLRDEALPAALSQLNIGIQKLSIQKRALLQVIVAMPHDEDIQESQLLKFNAQAVSQSGITHAREPFIFMMESSP